jgi:hypothetical protein
MTTLLERAFQQAAAFPAVHQDGFADEPIEGAGRCPHALVVRAARNAYRVSQANC